jgi:hypothetical protein
MLPSSLFFAESKAWEARREQLRKEIHALKKRTDLSASERETKLKVLEPLERYITDRVIGDANWAIALRETEAQGRKAG